MRFNRPVPKAPRPIVGYGCEEILEIRCVVVLANVASEDKINILAMATKDATKAGIHCGNIVKEVAKITGGNGGGRPDMAQAGGRKPEKLPEMLEKAPGMIRAQLENA